MRCHILPTYAVQRFLAFRDFGRAVECSCTVLVRNGSNVEMVDPD